MQDIFKRADNKCEICKNENTLNLFKVEPKDEEILLCDICKTQITDTSKINESHFHCLNDTMWSDIDAVKVITYRLFKAMGKIDKLEEMYLEDDIKSWANDISSPKDVKIHRDVNGVILNNKDTVSVIKDLPVKGAGFTAKQGTQVRNISLVVDDETHIEGRVNGVKIHLKTCFLKKQ